LIEIPLEDGSVAKFPQKACKEAFGNVMNRRGAGDDAPPEHPLCVAARNSSDSWWSSSFYAEAVDPYKLIEDLSE
jgi:hypothetical protein